MAKKVKPAKMYVVVDSDGTRIGFKNFKDAEAYAIDTKERNETLDVVIMEVTGAWEVYYPEEPLPEAIGMDLEDL